MRNPLGLRRIKAAAVVCTGTARVLARPAKRPFGAMETLAFWLVMRVQVFAKRLQRADLSIVGSDSPRVLLDGMIFQWSSHAPGFGIARSWDRTMSEWSASGFARHVVVLDRGRTAPRYKGFSYRRAPPVRALNSATQRFVLEEICRVEAAVVFVSTYYTHPLRCRSILLLHDMTPEVLGWDLRDAPWKEKRSAIRHATSYIAVSESTVSDFRRVFPQETHKPLVVIKPGVDPVFYPAPREEIESLAKTFGLPKHYFLFTGQRHGYKNAELAFAAAAEFQTRTDMALLCVGGALALEPDLADLAGDLVVRAARLSDAQMRAAYSGAAALLYVSKYEGFGLPILEAMACGCPVITCDNSSQKEVAGPVAVYVDDSDPAGLARAMRHVLDDSVRAEMVAQGRKRSAEFVWAEKAAAVAEAVRECARLERR